MEKQRQPRFYLDYSSLSLPANGSPDIQAILSFNLVLMCALVPVLCIFRQGFTHLGVHSNLDYPDFSIIRTFSLVPIWS